GGRGPPRRPHPRRERARAAAGRRGAGVARGYARAARDLERARARRHQAALRPRRRPPAHDGGDRPSVRADARADPPDRGPGDPQDARQRLPAAGPPPPGVPRSVGRVAYYVLHTEPCNMQYAIRNTLYAPCPTRSTTS